jgi:ribosomal 50S subunit-associated protein YjgA (DUF615 family)
VTARLDRLREELEELLRAPQEDRQALERLARTMTPAEMELAVGWMRDFTAQQRDLTASVVEDVRLLIEAEDYLSGDETIVDAWTRFPAALRDRLRVYLVRNGVAPPEEPPEEPPAAGG